MDITQKITLDLDRRSVYTTVCAKQGDDQSRKLQVTLVSGGAVYKAPPGAQAKFRAQKPDGTMVLNPAVVNSDGTVTVELTRQTIAVPGEVTADVYLTDSTGSVLSSASFVIHVEPAPAGVQTDSENEFLHLVALVEQAESASVTAGQQAQAAAASAQRAQEAERSATQIVQAAATHAGRRDNPHGVTAGQVGAATSAALNAHTGNRSNPHGVTAAQIGAAPAGFGLGAASVSVDNWDNATKNGFYKSNKGTPDGDGNYWHGIVVNYSGMLCNQLVWKTWGTGSVMATRRINNSIPEEWEWVNPPMDTGVVYCTTRRYMGKPVYTKLIDCGTLPHNSRKNVSYGVTDPGGVGTGAPIVVIEVVAGTNDGASFPRFVGAGNTPSFTVSAYSGEMQIITTGMSGASSSKVYAQIWYTRQSM